MKDLGMPYWDASNCADFSRSACYDGHNGIDFNAQTIEVRAAEAGRIVKIVDTCQGIGDHCGDGYNWLGNQVWIDHKNGYATVYGHLKPDSIKVTMFLPINQGDILGEMGNSGNAFGVHLHFGLYFDANGDGKWSQDSANNEAVDPFGWKPWDGGTDPGMLLSLPLWKYPSNAWSYVNVEGGFCSGPNDQLIATFLAGSTSERILCNLGTIPAPASPNGFNQMIKNFFLQIKSAVIPTSISPAVTSSVSLSNPFTISVSFDPKTLAHMNLSQSQIFHWDSNSQFWQALDTSIDLVNNNVTAHTLLTGNFSLQAPLLCASDENEPGNDIPSYTIGPPQTTFPFLTHHQFDIITDEDWITFEATAEMDYTIKTVNLSDGVDTVIELYAGDGVTQLAANDNLENDKASKIIWTAPTKGIYYIRVSQAPGSFFGCSTSYDLEIQNNGYYFFMPYLRR